MKPGQLKRGEPIWIGVDFDGTLAYHEPGEPLENIGGPIPTTLERVKRWLAQGWTVKIMTARASPKVGDHEYQKKRIQAWCLMHVGHMLEVVCEKDPSMVLLLDDRAVAVKRNTGNILCWEEFDQIVDPL